MKTFGYRPLAAVSALALAAAPDLNCYPFFGDDCQTNDPPTDSPRGTFSGAALPTPHWDHDLGVRGFFLPANYESQHGTFLGSGTAVGIFAVPVPIDRPVGAPGPKTVTTYARWFVTCANVRDEFYGDPTELVFNTLTSEPQAFSGSSTIWRYTRGYGSLSSDGTGLTLTPLTWFLPKSSGGPDEPWTTMFLVKESDERPPTLPPGAHVQTLAEEPYRFPRAVEPGFFGDWHASIDEEYCLVTNWETGEKEHCGQLTGTLVVHLESLVAANVSEAYRGGVLGWINFFGEIDGDSASLHALFAGEATGSGSAKGILAVKTIADYVCTFQEGNKTEYDVLGQQTELELLDDQKKLRLVAMGQQFLLERDTRRNVPPQAQIVAPVDGTLFSYGQPIELAASFVDVNQTEPPPPEHVEWSDAQGNALAVTPIDGTRLRVLWRPNLTETGDQIVKLRVRDQGGLMASDSIHVRVGGDPPDAPTIFHPRPYLEGLTPPEPYVSAPAVVLLEGCGHDPSEGELPDAALEWSSSLDGPLGSGRVVHAALSPGSHMITLRATDSEGLSATSSLAVPVQPHAGKSPPQVRLIEPQTFGCSRDLSIKAGQKRLFVAESYDPDGPAATSLTWHLQKIAQPPPPRQMIGTGPSVLVTVPAGDAAGTAYRVSVTAEDADGQKHVSVARVVVVSNATVD